MKFVLRMFVGCSWDVRGMFVGCSWDVREMDERISEVRIEKDNL
jgi:hypothetical protein